MKITVFYCGAIKYFYVIIFSEKIEREFDKPIRPDKQKKICCRFALATVG